MRYLAIILWLLLGFLYWWIWDSNSAQCCGDSGLSGTTKTEAAAGIADDDATKSLDASDELSADEAAKLKADEEAKLKAEEEERKRIEDEKAAKAIAEAAKSNEAASVKTDKKLTLYFPYNNDNPNLSSSTQTDINEMISLAKQSGKSIVITGHTDDLGDDASNMTLGKRRADNIKRKLIRAGMDASKIRTASKGETDPARPNTSPENRRQNRRVEIVIQ